MGSRGHIPRLLENVFIATPDASRASSYSRSPSGAGGPPSATVQPKSNKARSKKRKPQKLNVTLSTSLLDGRLQQFSPTWLSGEKALLLQPAVENASSAGGLAQADHSAAGLLLLSEEVATVSAAVASVCAFWVLLGTALCFVLRMRRRKRRRQRRRSRADAAQTAMLDEMIRSELARGRARLQCDGLEYCAPTYANVPRHLVESTNAFDAVADSENLYCSIPATIHSEDGRGGSRPNGQLACVDASRSHDRRLRPTGSGSRNFGTRVVETALDTKTCSARLDHSRTQRCQEGGVAGRDTFIAREMSIRVTTVGLRQCTPTALAGLRRVPAGGSKRCKHASNDSRVNQKDIVFDKSRRKDPAGNHPMQSKLGRIGFQETTYPQFDRSSAVLPPQFCAAISSNSNYCSDVGNFRCRHHATVEGRAGDARCLAMTSSSSLSHHCPAQGASGRAAGLNESHGGELRPSNRPCTAAGVTNKAPVRFPKMGRSCLVMGELIRRDWVWRLGGGQPLGSLPVCERCDPCPSGRGLPAEVSTNNI